MAKFQAGMQPTPTSHVEEALSGDLVDQQEFAVDQEQFAKEQQQLIEQQQQQQQLEIAHQVQQQKFALEQAQLVQQQQRDQQQALQDKVKQQLLRWTAPQQQTMEMVVARQEATSEPPVKL